MENFLSPSNKLYNKIIEFDDEEKSIEFSVKYEIPILENNLNNLIELNTKNEEEFRFDIELKVKISSLRVVFLQQFYFNLIAFLLLFSSSFHIYFPFLILIISIFIIYFICYLFFVVIFKINFLIIFYHCFIIIINNKNNNININNFNNKFK